MRRKPGKEEIKGSCGGKEGACLILPSRRCLSAGAPAALLSVVLF